MKWYTIILVFHVLRLNLCVAYKQVCPAAQYLNESGVCVNCTVCKQPEKKLIIRPCSFDADTVCGSIEDIFSKKFKSRDAIDVRNRILDVGSEADLSKESLADVLYLKGKKVSKLKLPKIKDDSDVEYYYYDDDDDDDSDDDDYDDDKSIQSGNKKDLLPDLPSTLNQSLKDNSNKSKANRLGIQIKKDLSKNAVSTNPLNDEFPSVEYSVFKDSKIEEDSATEPDSIPKKKSKSKKKNSSDTDHLKIGNTKFVINYDGRWLHLTHPHVVDKKIFVDLAKDKKASTFFSSSQKSEDREYAKEMDQILGKISSVVGNNNNASVLNTTSSSVSNEEEFTMIKNLDDEDEDDEDEDDDDEDNDKDDDDEDEDEDDDDDDDDDYNFVYNSGLNRSQSLDNSLEKIDSELDDNYDILDNDIQLERKWLPPNDVKIDVIAEPFSATANWQILILVSAMSACLLFFVVVSTYVCIYMRKRRQFKTNFEADVEDLSVRVNLMQHAGFEADDTSNIKNYITQLRGVKSNNEKLPKSARK